MANVALLNSPAKRFHARITDKNVGMPRQDYPTIAPGSIMPALDAASPPSDLCPPGSVDRHSRPPDVFPFTLAKTPAQNELIGSIRRECTDHIVIFGERHLRHVLLSYMGYYNGTRTHLSLNKDAPVPRGVKWAGNIVCRPILGGLHHQYGRM